MTVYRVAVIGLAVAVYFGIVTPLSQGNFYILSPKKIYTVKHNHSELDICAVKLSFRHTVCTSVEKHTHLHTNLQKISIYSPTGVSYFI